MKNTMMIRSLMLAGLVLGSSMAQAWRAPINVKVQPSWLSQNGKTLAFSATGLGLAAFLVASIYKYNKSTTTTRTGKLGYFGFIWDGLKSYKNAASNSFESNVRRSYWRSNQEKVTDLTAKNGELQKQLDDEKDASKKTELAKKLQPKIDANNKTIADLNVKIKAEADKAEAAKKAVEAKAEEAKKKAAETSVKPEDKKTEVKPAETQAKTDDKKENNKTN